MKENLWLLEQINQFVEKVAGRIIQRISLLHANVINPQQMQAIQQQVIVPTVSCSCQPDKSTVELFELYNSIHSSVSSGPTGLGKISFIKMPPG